MDGTAPQRIGISLLTWSILLFGLITGGALFKEMDGRMFPVVQEFQVIDIATTGGGVYISGTMNKSRDCYFREIAAYVQYDDDTLPHAAPVEFDNAPVASRPAIEQAWGPWLVGLSDDYQSAEIALYTRHSCHSLWDTSSKLTSFRVRKDGNAITMRD